MKNCTDYVLRWIRGQRPIILHSSKLHFLTLLLKNIKLWAANALSIPVLKTVFVLFVLSITNRAFAQNLTYTTSWLGNSGAVNSLYVQEEMHNLWISPEGTSYVCTWWDEDKRLIGVYGTDGSVQTRFPSTDIPYGSDIGGNSTAVFAAETTVLYRFLRSTGYTTGNISVPGNSIMGIAASDTEVFVSSLNGSVYVYNASTLASVRNFSVGGSGRIALDGAGFLWVITGNTTLKRYSSTGVLQSQSITLPAGNIAAAVTVNKANNTLYVIDRGVDQNIKVYTTVVTSPTRASDFGAVGGIYSGARPGLAGSQRFAFSAITDSDVAGHVFGTCGVGVDSNGNIYVLYGSNSAGRIEKYNSGGIFQWRLIGHTFEEGAYIDPTTDETDVYCGENHYKMNYSSAANTEMASWYGTAAAINGSNGYSTPVRPDRGFASLSAMRIANIAGSKFIYMQAQRGDMYVFGMPGNTETFTNSAITDENGIPTWTRGSITDIDANGTMWSGDNANIIEKYVCTGVSAGKPVYNLNAPITYPIPAPYPSGGVSTKYIAETDVMYLIGTTTGTSGSKCSRYNNWSTSRTLVYTVDLKFTVNQEDVKSFDVAGDYIFTDYYGADQTSGPAFGLVKVWSAATGAFVMNLQAPANYNAGDSDNISNTRAFKRSNGEYIITFLDHLQTKTVVFRWCPSGTCASSTVAVTGVSVIPTTASVVVGGNTTLTKTIAPSNATNQSVTWSSNNTSVATVNASGVVTGVSVGSATITVTTADGSKTASCAVTVTSSNVAVTGVSVSPTSVSVSAGANTTLTKTIAPSNATNQNVTWSSNNTSIATVNASGVVTGVAAGSATITVTSADGSKTATSAVTVTSSSSSGSVTGSVAINTNAVNLTTIGSSDWKHFRSNVRKSSGSNSISNPTVVGGSAINYTDDARAMSWTGGTPTATGTNVITGKYNEGIGNGFSFTAPAGNGVNTLYVYVGGWNSSGTLTARLSNSAAADYVHTTSSYANEYDAVYTISYNAAQTGQTITVSWKQASGAGNVTIQAAALGGSSVFARVGTPRSATETVKAEPDQSLSAITVYPNPATNFITIDFKRDLKSDEAQVEIVDAMGRKMFSSGTLSHISTLQISTSHYSKGAYIVKVQQGFEMVTKKLIIE
jgi:uncharacterized protein YjdB